MCSTKAESPAAAPRDAATLVLLRDAPEGMQVLLVQRATTMEFMGGLHVFPGGKLDTTDLSTEMRECIGGGATSPAVRAFADAVDDAHALGLSVAVVRETLEEAGILLGVDARPAALDALRHSLLEGRAFSELLHTHGVMLNLSELTALSRWITPVFERRRYDTRFYLARAPVDQEACIDSRETTSLRWVAPAEAIELARTGALRLAPPTLHTLEQLALWGDIDQALASAAARPPPCIEPLLRPDGDAVVVVYPGDPEHPVQEPAMPGPTRLRLPKR